MNNIQVINKISSSYGEFLIDEIEITPPFEMPKTMCIGIDPGTTNLGFCVLHKNLVKTYKVKLKRDKNPIDRMLNTKKILSHIINYQDYEVKVCIEGASYGDTYRQVELAEIRAACVFWALDHGMKVRIAQPSEIRKAVFGNGTIKGKDIWKSVLSGDAADAVACAYFAGLILYPIET